MTVITKGCCPAAWDYRFGYTKAYTAAGRQWMANQDRLDHIIRDLIPRETLPAILAKPHLYPVTMIEIRKAWRNPR